MRYTIACFNVPSANDTIQSLQLVKAFYSEGLIDNRTFLAWLVQQVGTCNLAQLGFVARLADEYLDGLLNCRALARPFADASFGRISEVSMDISVFHFIAEIILDCQLVWQGTSRQLNRFVESVSNGQSL